MATQKTEVLTVLEVDVLTGVTKERQLTTDEIAQRKTDAAQAQAQQAEAQAKAAARESALAKLADLGLTEEEITAL